MTGYTLLRTQSAKNTIFAFPKTFTIFYLSIYYFKAKVRLIITLIMVILGNADIADWVLSRVRHAKMMEALCQLNIPEYIC